MKKMRTLTLNLAANRNGATVVGYSLIAGLLALVVAVIVTSVGATLEGYPETGASASSTVA
jgi:Flp pilus assembly pilin Flp